MKKAKLNPGWFILIGVGVLALFLVLWFVGSYNGLIKSDEEVNAKWANVQSAYQRRADLIPNLVATVQGSADFEKDTLTEVTQLRSEAVAAQTGVRNANTPEELSSASSTSESVLGRFLVIMENYPQLRSTENFLSFQDQLEGTENRIKTERDIFNEAVRKYNVKVRRIPTNIVAGMFGFNTKEMFEADEGSSDAPDVVFN